MMAVFRLLRVRRGRAERLPHGVASRVAAGAGTSPRRRTARGGELIRRCGVSSGTAWSPARCSRWRPAIMTRRLDAPLGVLGGGALVAISYRGIKAGIAALVARAMPAEDERSRQRAAAGKVAVGLVKFFTRYAILAARRVRDNGALAAAPGGRLCGCVLARNRGDVRSPARPSCPSPGTAPLRPDYRPINGKARAPTLDRPGRECCVRPAGGRACCARSASPRSRRRRHSQLPRDVGADHRVLDDRLPDRAQPAERRQSRASCRSSSRTRVGALQSMLHDYVGHKGAALPGDCRDDVRLHPVGQPHGAHPRPDGADRAASTSRSAAR